MIPLLLLLAAQDWPQFRGPGGQGHAAVTSLPLEWSDDSANVAWKSPVDGLGWSSPVVSGTRVWMTTATDEGRSLRAVCLDLETGRGLLDVEVFRRAEPGRRHKKNSHASPTPVLDGDRVYVHFGPYGTACLSAEGGILWKRTIPYQPVHGNGGSPALDGGRLFISCDGGDTQFVAALDAKTGRTVWKTPRVPNSYFKKFAFSTPLVIETGGSRRVVSAGAGGVSAHAPDTGRIVWHAAYVGGYSVVPRPVHGHGMIYLSTGYDTPEILAIRTGGKGDVTKTHIAWRLTANAPRNASPLLVGDELYVVSDRGIATCLDARTGKQHWRERLGGNFSASPLHAAGRIYFLDEAGTTTVIEPGTTFKQLARNTVRGRTLASPAPVEGALLLRTDTHLLRINSAKR